jgi:hypothetical protein
VKGITKAFLSRTTNVKARRYEGAAFTSRFIDDALRTKRKVLDLDGGGSALRRILSYFSLTAYGGLMPVTTFGSFG